MKTNQSRVEFKAVKMPTRSFLILICLTSLVTIINGYDLRTKQQAMSPTPEECMRPPMTKHGHECCKLPKEKIWGDLRGSLNMCLKKVKQESKSIRQEMEDDGPDMVTPEGSDVITSTENPSDSASVPGTSSYSTTPRHRDRRPYGKRPRGTRCTSGSKCCLGIKRNAMFSKQKKNIENDAKFNNLPYLARGTS